jgi:hypothetical protein
MYDYECINSWFWFLRVKNISAYEDGQKGRANEVAECITFVHKLIIIIIIVRKQHIDFSINDGILMTID